MARRAKALLATAYFVAFAAMAAPACATRDLACPDFDSCDAASECPLVRCVCGAGEVTQVPTCREDGTCTTILDCAEVCASSGCARPPADCLAFVPTECACGGSPRFAAAWNCVDGDAEPTSAADCADACGSSSTSTSTGTSGSSSAAGSSP